MTSKRNYPNSILQCPPLTVKDEDALRHLADDLPQLWHHDAAPFDLKKRIVRTVIKEIIVFVDKKTLRGTDTLAWGRA